MGELMENMFDFCPKSKEKRHTEEIKTSLVKLNEHLDVSIKENQSVKVIEIAGLPWRIAFDFRYNDKDRCCDQSLIDYRTR